MATGCRLEHCERMPVNFRGMEFARWKFKGDKRKKYRKKADELGIAESGGVERRLREMRAFLKDNGFELTDVQLRSWLPTVTVEEWKRR